MLCCLGFEPGLVVFEMNTQPTEPQPQSFSLHLPILICLFRNEEITWTNYWRMEEDYV